MSNIININVNKTDLGLNNVDNTSDLNKPISTATQTALNGKEDVSNKSTNTSLGTSDTLYPTQKAVKTYVDNHAVSLPDATASVKGVIKLTGDLGGTADSPTVPALSNYLLSSLKGANNGLAELDGSGKVPSSQLPSYVEYVAPEMFGAIGDGTTDDTTAFQNAINSGKPVVLGKATYYISAPLNVTNNRTIVGYGYESKIKTTTNMSCILIQGSNNYISGVSFLGSGKGVVGKEEQIGINIFGNVGLTDNFNKNVIDNCFFTDMSGSGFYGKQVVGTYHEGNTVSNCVAFNCTQGFYLDLRFEYTNVNSCKASNCNIGGRIRGGNNNFSNCNFSDNLYNIYLESGSNDGHGSFVGGQLNHAEVNNILSNGIALGYTFNGTQIYAGGTGDAGNITLAGDNLISFVGCMISVEYFDFGTSVNTKLVGNSFDTTPIYQNYVAANVWFGNNVYKTTRPTEDPVNKIIANATTDTDKFLVSDSDVIKYRTGAELLSDINGASKDLTLDRKTASYTLVSSDNNKLIEMNVGSANNVTIDSGVFTAGNQILVSQYGAGQTTITAGAGVTLRSSGGKLKTSAQYSLVTIIAISSTEFYIAGDLTA